MEFPRLDNCTVVARPLRLGRPRPLEGGSSERRSQPSFYRSTEGRGTDGHSENEAMARATVCATVCATTSRSLNLVRSQSVRRDIKMTCGLQNQADESGTCDIANDGMTMAVDSISYFLGSRSSHPSHYNYLSQPSPSLPSIPIHDHHLTTPRLVQSRLPYSLAPSLLYLAGDLATSHAFKGRHRSPRLRLHPPLPGVSLRRPHPWHLLVVPRMSVIPDPSTLVIPLLTLPQTRPSTTNTSQHG